MKWIGQRSEVAPKLTLGCKPVKLPGLRHAVNLVLVSRGWKHSRLVDPFAFLGRSVS